MLENVINKNRKGWIDALRGLAIILVIYGHNIQNTPEFYIFTSPIKMPLFFAISGYLFKPNKNWPLFLNSIFKKLVVPWVLLGLFVPIMLIPFQGIDYLYNYILQMLSGKVLWFMPCLIIAEIIYYIILHCSKTDYWIIIISFSCFVLGLLFYSKGILNYAMINRALSVQPFFLIGLFFYKYETKIININWLWFTIITALYIGMCFLSMRIYPEQSLDVHMNRYYNIPFNLFQIIIGCFLLFYVTRQLNVRSNIMSFLGQNTLLLYMWHGIAIVLFVRLLQFAGWNMPNCWWVALLKTIWAIILCCGCSLLINKYIPFIVGKNKVNNKT